MSTMSCCDSVPALFEDNLSNQVKPKSVFFLFFFLSFFFGWGCGWDRENWEVVWRLEVGGLAAYGLVPGTLQKLRMLKQSE